MSPARRIAIADADPFARERVRLVTETSASQIIRIAEADCFSVLLDLLREDPAIDLVIVDLNLPGMSSDAGLRLLPLAKDHPRIAVLVEDATATLLGPAGVNPANVIPKALPEGLFAKVVGRILDDGKIADAPPNDRRSHAPFDNAELTSRQRDVLRLLSRGYSNSEIARSLGVAEGTVKVHVNAAFRMLRVHNRVQAAAAFRTYLQERERINENEAGSR